MALQVWLPLNGDLHNQGLNKMTFSNSNGSSTIVVNDNGKIGKCYSRSSSKSAGRIISNSTINLNGDLSMFCWAKVTACVGDTANGLVSNHSHANNTGFGITVKQVSTSDFRISCNTGNGSNRTYMTYYGTSNIKDKWCHLGLTYNNTKHEFKLWVNGICEKTVSYTNSSREDYIMIFDWSTTYGSNDYKPACFINDVRIYDHALSPKEVKELSKGLVLHYKLDDSYVTQTHVTQTQYDKTLYTEPDGTYWVRIAHHNNPAGGVFTSSSANWANGVYIDSNRWFDVYGTLKYLYSFEFMVKQKTTSSAQEIKYRWVQNKSPLIATYNDVAPSVVTRITSTGYTNGGFGGLYILNSNTHMCIANSSNGNWYGAFGCWTTWNGGIPGYPNTGITSGYMDLYVKVNYIPVYDCSGYLNNGILTGSLIVNQDSSRYNYSSLFSSTESNYITIPYQGITGPYSNKELTFSFWINTQQQGNRHMIFGIVGSYNMNIELSSSNALRVYWAGTPDWSPGITCTLNTWTHIGIVVSSTYIKCYKNGVLIGTNTTTPNWAGCSQNLMIGSDQRIGTYFLGAKLSDFRIYSTLLSDTDIRELYDTAGSIDNQGDSLFMEFDELNTNINISKRGIIKANQFKENGNRTRYFNNKTIESTQFLEI